MPYHTLTHSVQSEKRRGFLTQKAVQKPTTAPPFNVLSQWRILWLVFQIDEAWLPLTTPMYEALIQIQPPPPSCKQNQWTSLKISSHCQGYPMLQTGPNVIFHVDKHVVKNTAKQGKNAQRSYSQKLFIVKCKKLLDVIMPSSNILSINCNPVNNSRRWLLPPLFELRNNVKDL